MADKTPVSFFDLSWLAVRGAPAEDLIVALDLSEPTWATWRQGIGAVAGDFWDFDARPDAFLSRVYICPQVRGWRLVVGGWLGGMKRKKPGSDVAAWCRRLSKEFGEAHAFTSQGSMDWYSWCLARTGSVARHFIWASEALLDQGTPPRAEECSRVELAKDARPWSPSEAVVMAIAGECSIDPTKLESMQSVGPGCIAVTAWGRKHGVPSRSLDE